MPLSSSTDACSAAESLYSCTKHLVASRHCTDERNLGYQSTLCCRLDSLRALLKDMAKVPFQADRIFSQAESGRPKTEVLSMLQERHPDTMYHFVEDKFGTLEKVNLKLTDISAYSAQAFWMLS